MNTYNYLDYVPKGRDEDGLAFTLSWLRHHDRYADGRLPDADMPYWPAELCPHVEYSSTLNPDQGLPLSD